MAGDDPASGLWLAHFRPIRNPLDSHTRQSQSLRAVRHTRGSRTLIQRATIARTRVVPRRQVTGAQNRRNCQQRLRRQANTPILRIGNLSGLGA